MHPLLSLRRESRGPGMREVLLRGAPLCGRALVLGGVLEYCQVVKISKIGYDNSRFILFLRFRFGDLEVDMKPIKKSGWGLASLSKIASVLILISLMLSPLGTFPVLAMDSPVLTAPSDGANIEAAEATPLGVPVFEWQAVPEAAQYRFQLSNTIGFSTLVINITTDNTRYAPVISSLIDGLWYWRVRVEKPVASD